MTDTNIQGLSQLPHFLHIFDTEFACILGDWEKVQRLVEVGLHVEAFARTI
jgi:hypothetical protein